MDSICNSMRAHKFPLPAVQVGETNHERRAEKLEKKLARYAIMPVLQAEEDRRSGPLHCTLHSGSQTLADHLVCLGCVPGAGGSPPATPAPRAAERGSANCECAAHCGGMGLMPGAHHAVQSGQQYS